MVGSGSKVGIGEGIKRVTLGMSLKTGHGLDGQGGIARRG